MKNRLISTTIVGVGITYIFKYLALVSDISLLDGLSNVTLLLAFGLPIASHSKISSFLYVVLSMIPYGIIYSLVYPQYGFSLLWLLGNASLMGILVVFASRLFKSGENEERKKSFWKYGIRGLMVIVIYDLITGVVIPCVSGYDFTTLFLMQIEWTFTHTIFSLVPVIFSPYIYSYIMYGVPHMKEKSVSVE